MNEHVCDLKTLDYSRVDKGIIVCTACPRRWWTTPAWPKGRRWNNNLPPPSPQHPDHWPKDFERWDETNDWEHRSTRQERLARLDLIERRRRDQFSETEAVIRRARATGKAPKAFKPPTGVALRRPDRRTADPSPKGDPVRPAFTHRSVFKKS